MYHNPHSFDMATVYCGGVGDRVARFMPMVRKLAWHLSGSGGSVIDVDDLVQAGLVALTECARKHGSRPDDGFAAYAKMRVRGAMVDMLRSLSPDPRGSVRKRRELEAHRIRLQSAHGRDPTAQEMAEALGLSMDAYFHVEKEVAATQLHSIDDCYTDGSADFASDNPDAEASLLQAEDRALLLEAIGALPERQQMVIQLYFVEELNLSEIAEILQVSTPRVHQLKANALASLRKVLA